MTAQVQVQSPVPGLEICVVLTGCSRSAQMNWLNPRKMLSPFSMTRKHLGHILLKISTWKFCIKKVLALLAPGQAAVRSFLLFPERSRSSAINTTASPSVHDVGCLSLSWPLSLRSSRGGKDLRVSLSRLLFGIGEDVQHCNVCKAKEPAMQAKL